MFTNVFVFTYAFITYDIYLKIIRNIKVIYKLIHIIKYKDKNIKLNKIRNVNVNVNNNNYNYINKKH